LTITNVYDDVALLDEQQLQEVLVSNYTKVAGSSPFIGTPGEVFTVDADLTFQACPCVHQVTEVDSLTPGFTVMGTSPPAPLPFGGQGGDFYEADFTIEVMAPSTPYNGTLTLVAHVQ